MRSLHQLLPFLLAHELFYQPYIWAPHMLESFYASKVLFLMSQALLYLLSSHLVRPS